MKRILWILGISAVILGLGFCDRGPLFVCYSGWGAGHFYMMYDEPELPPAQPGEPSMSEAEWQELVRLNQPLGADGKPRQ